MFQDITTLLLDPKAFRDAIDLFVERYKDKGITVVAGNDVPFSFHLTLIVSSAIDIFMCCAILISRNCFHENQALKLEDLFLALPLL
jgi:hypothetical protein